VRPGGPFTVVVCDGGFCGEHGRSVVEGLRDCVRGHPHAMLVSAGCLLGRAGCHAFAAGRGNGALVMVQPCTIERRPVGPALWAGPVADDADLADLLRWLDGGDLRAALLPARLRFRAAVAAN